MENLRQRVKGDRKSRFSARRNLRSTPYVKKRGSKSKATPNSNKKTLEIIHTLFEGVSSLTASRWCKIMLCVTLQTSITTLTCT